MLSGCGRGWAPLVLAALACACGGGSDEAGAPNALLVTLDTTRTDAVGVYGAPDGVTPTLDALAAEGVVFTRARTVTPMTLPAHASMLTGLYPPRHTVRDNAVWSLPVSANTLAESAREAGYATAAFVSTPILDRVFALDQGFEHWSQPVRTGAPVEGSHGSYTPGEDIAAQVIDWLATRPADRPFLVWMHLYDPHVPLTPPGHLMARIGDPYLAEVARADAAVGAVFDALRAEGAFDETLIVVVGDHGESNGEHGEATHGTFVFDGAMRVPLIVRPARSAPSRQRAGLAGATDDTIATVADIYPTVAAALGLGVEDDLDGIDLLAGPHPEDRGVYFELYHGFLHFGWSPLAGWADARGKYIHSSSPELYDPAADPGETDNLIESADPERLAYYRARIGDVAGRVPLEVASASAEAELLSEIRALGYAEATVETDLPHPLDEVDRPSPHERVEELELCGRVRNLSSRGKSAAAIKLCRQILASNPNNHLARTSLAYELQKTGALDEAIDLYRDLLANGTENAWTHAALGRALDQAGRPEEALDHLRRAADLDPGDRSAIRELIRLLNREGHDEEAARWREHLASG